MFKRMFPHRVVEFKIQILLAETAAMTKNQILQQAGTSILAQSNQFPQAALSLI